MPKKKSPPSERKALSTNAKRNREPAGLVNSARNLNRARHEMSN